MTVLRLPTSVRPSSFVTHDTQKSNLACANSDDRGIYLEYAFLYKEDAWFSLHHSLASDSIACSRSGNQTISAYVQW